MVARAVGARLRVPQATLRFARGWARLIHSAATTARKAAASRASVRRRAGNTRRAKKSDDSVMGRSSRLKQLMVTAASKRDSAHSF